MLTNCHQFITSLALVSLLEHFQAFLNHVAAALLHRQISIVALKLVQNFIRCPSNPEVEYELYYIVPAAICSYAQHSKAEAAKESKLH